MALLEFCAMATGSPSTPDASPAPETLGDLFRSAQAADNPPPEQVEGALTASWEHLSAAPAQPAAEEFEAPQFTPPTEGMVVTSEKTRNTYTIGRLIGEGAFGRVYEATDVWRNQLAVKVLKPSGRTYAQVREDANNEFGKLLTLRHPNVTHVLDAFEYQDTFYIITERCLAPLSNLFDIQNLNGATWLMPLARCLLQAVHFLHVYDWVHQDIHFGNVFMMFHRDEMPAGAVGSPAITFKLGDLGLTKLRADMDAQNTMLNNSMLPPEFLDANQFGQLGPQVDIYHCGLLFLQLMVNRPLTFTPEEIVAGLPRIQAEQLPAPYNIAISKALRRHVAMRTQDAMELWRDLNAPSVPDVPFLLQPLPQA